VTASSLSVPDGPVRDLGVSVGVGADQIVVAVRGELDLATAPQLACVLAAVVDRAADIALDLAELDFLDPAGLRVIAAASIRLRQSGRELTLRSVPAMARRILDITGVDALVRIEPSDPQVAALGPVRLGGGRSAADLPRRATPQPDRHRPPSGQPVGELRFRARLLADVEAVP